MKGLSLSFCVRQIANNKVNLQDVECIIASTKAPTPEAWESVIADYKKFYWHNFPERAEGIARQLIAEGKILQPRLGDYIPAGIKTLEDGSVNLAHYPTPWID